MQLVVLHYHWNPGGVTSVVAGHLRALEHLPPDQRPTSVFLLSGPSRHNALADHASSLRLQHHTLPQLAYDPPPQLGPLSSQHGKPQHGKPERGGHPTSEPGPRDRAEPGQVSDVGDLTRLPQIQNLHAALRQWLDQRQLRPGETVLHVHNHSLGKNAPLPAALRLLAADGFGLLCQIHDFAEDFRPRNYLHLRRAYGQRLPDILYPVASHVHYAVLNHRDRQLLRSAGLPDDRLHWLPNPVSEPPSLPSSAEARGIWRSAFPRSPLTGRRLLYPVRGIRRKNLGEVLLWGVLLEHGGEPRGELVVTLAPQNPLEGPVYQHWRRLAHELRLPIVLDSGGAGGVDFATSIAASDAHLTTSVAEGFGMVYLETWLAGRPLLGRDLPEITSDFRAAGVQFPDTYEQLLVPTDWVGTETCRKSLREAYGAALTGFGCSWPASDELERGLDRLMDGRQIDFARLPVDLQTKVLRLLAGGPERSRRRAELEDSNPQLARILAGSWEGPSVVASNRGTILRQFGLPSCGQRLYDVYQRVLSSPREAEIGSLEGSHRILPALISLDRIHPVRFAESP